MDSNDLLGRLEQVDLRRFWSDEARDFTPWLAMASNLELLSNTLGIELETTNTEVHVGPYRTDILALDIASNTKVVIENQLNKTDHDHLGKSLVYAAGHDAKIIIWIAKEFSEEHRRAVDFLNENAAPDLRFFAIEIQLWRIGHSLPAPLFKIVASPNDFTSTIRATEKGQLTGVALIYQQFWSEFKQYCVQHNTSLRIQNRKPLPQHWFPIAIGRSHFDLYLTASMQHRRLGCEIYISGAYAKKSLKKLMQYQDEIEAKTGPLQWYEKTSGQDCRIFVKKPDINISDNATWPTAFMWLKQEGELFHKTFAPYIKALPTLDTVEDVLAASTEVEE